MSEFFHLLHLEQHIGVSADSLRKQEIKLKAQIIADEQEQQQGIQPSQPIEICVGSDEVFFGDPVLVTLELSSGFILIETAADNRQDDTWQAQADNALPPEKFHCRQMVSDGAKALIKLALKGLGCQWIPDLFHLLWNLGKPFSCAIGRQLGQLNNQLNKVQARLEKAQQQGKNTQELEVQLGQLQQQQEQIEKAQQTYSEAVHEITTQVHPFRLDGTTAAQRLFGQPFPDLFEWVVDHMGELPRPRKSKKSAKSKMPTLQSVPA